MIVFLIRERIVSKSDYGFTDLESFFDVKTFNQERIQFLVDIFIGSIDSIKPEGSGNEISEYQLMNGNTIAVPNWYFVYRGHDLEIQIKELFPALKRFQREEQLKKEIITKVYEDMPEIIPLDLIDLFESIRSG